MMVLWRIAFLLAAPYCQQTDHGAHSGCASQPGWARQERTKEMHRAHSFAANKACVMDRVNTFR